MRDIHSLLKRQLKRYIGDPASLPDGFQDFLTAINDAYWEYDEDRAMLERSLDLSSQELLQANSELRALIRAFPDLFVWIDEDGVIIECKEGSTDDLIVPHDQMIGKHIQKIPLPRVGQQFNEAIQLVKDGGRVVSMEYSLPINGIEYHYEARILPILENQYLCIVRNISEAKQAEFALARSREEFRILYEESKKTEQVYRSLIHSSADAIIIYDLEGRVRYVSPAFTEIFGWTQAEVEGDRIPFIPETEVDATKDTIKTVVKEGRSIQGYEAKRLTRDGRLLDISYSASRFNDHEGKPSGTLFVLRDITEKKKLAARFREAEKMEAVGALAGGVAHDLNNILGGLVSYPEVLLMSMEEDNPLRKSILKMQSSGQKAAAIVQDMLTLARRGVAVPEVVDVNSVVEEYLTSPEHDKLLKSHPNILVETEIEPGSKNILGSPVQLFKSVMNLVTNAAEAMPSGGTISIEAGSCYLDTPVAGYETIEEGDYVSLTIRDSGSGISAGNLERIFEPFFTRKVLGRSGTGLGLSVVWGTVKDHNGFIDVKSTEGEGTSFSVYFPLTRIEAKKEEAEISIEEYLGNGETILVVDDVLKQLEIASDMLQRLGYSVITAISGEEAVEYLKEQRVDLVVLDMIMDPGIDGLETYRRILQLHPGQKAVITSGFSESERVREARSLGAGSYVKKPYMLKNIGVAVREELDGRSFKLAEQP